MPVAPDTNDPVSSVYAEPWSPRESNVDSVITESRCVRESVLYSVVYSVRESTRESPVASVYWLEYRLELDLPDPRDDAPRDRLPCRGTSAVVTVVAVYPPDLPVRSENSVLVSSSERKDDPDL